MRHNLVAALSDRRHYLRCVVVHQAIGVVRGGQLQLIEELQQPPDADAIAIVTPGIVAMRLRLARLRRVVTQAGTEGEPFDVGGDDECEALAARPAVVAPLRERYKIVAVVLRQELQIVISRTYSPPAWRSTAKTMPRSSTNTSLICAVLTGEPYGLGAIK